MDNVPPPIANTTAILNQTSDNERLINYIDLILILERSTRRLWV